MMKFSREQRNRMTNEVQAFFETERGESIGTIGADQLIDRMVEILGPAIYNQAIQDARKSVMEKLNQLEDELFTLERPER